MKIITVVGARPQFIKAAAVSRKLRKSAQELIIHTGQHYDSNMSDIFFSELDIPKPDFSLNIHSGSHGSMTGQMLQKIEEIFIEEKPDTVLVYGDTNSTLAGALAASKLHIKVAHVEAGLRSFNKLMPEEQNRILTDHISDLLFAPTETAVKNLSHEGITAGVVRTGDVMYDAILFYQDMAEAKSKSLEENGLEKEKYVLATIHRAENTDDIQRLRNIIEGLNCSDEKIVLPLHPRTRKYINEYGIKLGNNITILEPVGYLDMIKLEKNASKIVTDSGGVQKEAFFMSKPCVTLRDETEWIETVDCGWNKLVGADKMLISESIVSFTSPIEKPELFGDGHSAERIIEKITVL